MLTIKSDDVIGRSKAYESIIRGEPIEKPSVPASFNVLVRELQSLGLSVEMIDSKSGEIQLPSEGNAKDAQKVEAPATEEAVKDEGPEAVEDKKLTEIYVGQEENPPQEEELGGKDGK
jgi:DNA-directed RNA polymerase subunit beta